jgi:hypothetical protein
MRCFRRLHEDIVNKNYARLTNGQQGYKKRMVRTNFDDFLFNSKLTGPFMM